MESALANLEAAMQSLQEAKSSLTYDSSAGTITTTNQLDAGNNGAGTVGNDAGDLSTQADGPGYSPMDGPMTGSGSTMVPDLDVVGADPDTVGIDTNGPTDTVQSNEPEGMGEEHGIDGWWSQELEGNPDNAGVDFNAPGNTSYGEQSWGDPNDSDDDDGIAIELYENELFDYEDSVFTVGGTTETPIGDIGGEIDVLGYEVEAGVSVVYQDGEFTAGATAEASAYLIQAEATGDFGPLSIGVDGMIGAEATADVGLEFDWEEAEIELGAEIGFTAGAEASANAELDLYYGAVEGTVTGIAGVSAEAHGNIELENWQLSYDLGASAALGLGLGFETEGAIDLHQIGTDAVAVGTAIGETAVDVGTAIGETAVNVGNAIGETASNVGTSISNTATDIGNATAEVFEDVVEFGEDAIDVAGEALDAGLDAGGELIEDVGETLEDITNAVGGIIGGF